MKKICLLLFAFSLFSCNSDSDTTVSTTSQLVKMEQKVYENGNIAETIIQEYSNQKPTRMSFYDPNNHLTWYTTFEYTNNGLLNKVKNYSGAGILNAETIITYDNQNRITSTEAVDTSNPQDPMIVSFTYNSNNTITSSNNSTAEIKIFELNSNGVIFKEIVNGNTTTTVVYDNLKPLTKTSYSTTYTYSYNPTGRYPFSPYSIFGSYLSNVVLFNNSLNDGADQLTTELISEITSQSQMQHSTYTLNSDGFPLTTTTHRDGALKYTRTYIYQ